MQKLIYTFSIIFFSMQLFAQDLILHQDYPGITWPFLWDMEQDEDGRFYVCSERGVLYIKSNGTWEEIDLDPNGQDDAWGIAVDDNGVIWTGTENGLFSIDNGDITHFTSANSQLPSDDLREVRAYGDDLWIVLNLNGIAKKTGDDFTHYTESNSTLGNNFVRDLEIMDDGTVVVGADGNVNFIKNGNWQFYNIDDFSIFGNWVYDIFVDHNQDVWFGTKEGVMKYTTADQELTWLNDEYGQKDFSGIIYTPDNRLWLGELFEGLHYYDDFGNNFYFDGSVSGVPSQVFDFIYYDDTVRVTGNIGATTTGLTINFPDNDGDGFGSDVDCDDDNENVNPSQSEIAYNGVDDDCNEMTPDDDLDQDGFLLADDCNDNDETINPNATEIPNNGIDEDCDGSDLIIDAVHKIGRSSIKIFPNPVASYLYLEVGQPMELAVTLYDSKGRLVIEKNMPTQISVENLPNGIYLMNIRHLSTNEMVQEKIVVMK